MSKYGVAWLLEIIAYCSVNCFGIISGYNYYGRRPNLTNLLYLLAQVIFYAILINCIFLFLNQEINFNVWLKTFFPITGSYNWYINSYAGMFLFIPMMNNFIENQTEKNLKAFMLIIIVWFSVLPTFFSVDPFKLAKGYSMLWLCILYLIGAFIKKYSLNKNITCKRAMAYFCIIVLLSWILKISLDNLQMLYYGKVSYGSRFIKYTSPLIVCSAIFLFTFFTNLVIKNLRLKKFIKLLLSTYFGVYIIHLHPMIWKNWIKNFAVGFSIDNTVIMILKILLVMFLIYTALSLMDYIRLKLFECLDVKNKLNNLSKKLEIIIFSKF